MGGKSGSLDMMGRQLVVHCTTGTCDRGRVVWGSWVAYHLSSKEVWCKDCIACPCALHVRWAASNARGLSTKCRHWLMPEVKVCCLRVRVGWKAGKNQWTAAVGAAPLGQGVLLAPERESGSVCWCRDAPYRHESQVWCPQEMMVWLTRSFHPAMNLE